MSPRNLQPHYPTLIAAVVLTAALVLTQRAWAGPFVAPTEAPAAASSRTTINYQGYLTDASGSSVNTPLDIVFRLYDVASGGTPLWSETQFGVMINDGLFSVLLGSVTPIQPLLFDSHDDLWLGIAVGSDQEMSPREKLASAPYALGSHLPPGVIVIWIGSVAAVPSGWQLCDGTSGTPDLRDRFVVGAGASYSVGATGGAETISLTSEQMPSHTHTAIAGTTGAHTHTYERAVHVSECWDNMSTCSDKIDNTPTQTSSNGDHTHPITVAATGGGQAHENRPPYYSLAFICKQ